MSIIKFLCSIRTYLHAFTEDGVECQQMQRVEMDDWPVFMEPSCETLFMCFMTVQPSRKASELVEELVMF